jgi:acyl-CoA thioesterase-1
LRKILLLIAAVLAAAAAPAEGRETDCEAPPGLARLTAPLPALQAKLLRHLPATIVAIGSSSTSGAGASSPAHTYPAQLQAELLRRFPGARLTVYNKGVGGQTSAEMVARFERDVLALAPDLVIWQVGTNTVLRNLDVAEHDRIVRAGIARLQSTGLDLVLMDMQYAPMVVARAGHATMEERLAAAAADARISLFSRFAIMRHWIEKDGIEPDRLIKRDGLHLNDYGYGCIGRLLAASIAERVAMPPEGLTSRR